MFGVSRLIDMYAPAKTITLGMMMRRGGNRSSSVPIPGETIATVIAAMPNAFEIASRRQPKEDDRGSINRLNVYGMMAAKLTMTPMNAAAHTLQPGYRIELSGGS